VVVGLAVVVVNFRVGVGGCEMMGMCRTTLLVPHPAPVSQSDLHPPLQNSPQVMRNTLDILNTPTSRSIASSSANSLQRMHLVDMAREGGRSVSRGAGIVGCIVLLLLLLLLLLGRWRYGVTGIAIAIAIREGLRFGFGSGLGVIRRSEGG
jgi:hypothetical protein